MQTEQSQWALCEASLRAHKTEAGCVEVFWEHRSKDALALIRGYNVRRNLWNYFQSCLGFLIFSCLYSSLSTEWRTQANFRLRRRHSSCPVCTETKCMTFTLKFTQPNTPSFLSSPTQPLGTITQTIPTFPLHVTFTCACVTFPFQRIKIDDSTLTGAPLISFESCGDVTSLCIVWRHVSLPENPIDSYILYLNHQQCGDKVRPDRDSDRCKVVVSGCHVDTPYHVVVGALREGE